MLRGIVCNAKVAIPTILQEALEKGLIILRSGEHVLRIAPPLNIGKKEIDYGCAILSQLLDRAEKGYLK